MWRQADIVLSDVLEEHIAFLYPEVGGDAFFWNVS
jgi:hypothetical protein